MSQYISIAHLTYFRRIYVQGVKQIPLEERIFSQLNLILIGGGREVYMGEWPKK